MSDSEHVIPSDTLGKHLAELGLIPDHCYSFRIEGEVNQVLRVEYRCAGTDAWTKVDWGRWARQASSGKAAT